MATVIARLAVDDINTWTAEYERMHPVRERHGEQGRTLYLDVDDPSAVVVVFQWDTLDNARAYFGSEALGASVARAGGRTPPSVMFLERPDQLRRADDPQIRR